MKIKIYILLAAALSVFVSCGKESPEGASEEYGEKVVILLSTDSRSGGEQQKEGDPDDRTVASLRLLAYNHKTGVLYKNYPLVLPDAKDPQPIEILTGRYNFVFIANEGSDPAVKAALENTTDGVSLFSELDGLFFPASAFYGSQPIPMAAVCREIVIVGDQKYIDQSKELQEGVWPVQLERLGVRIDAQITFDDDLSPDDWELFLSNVPDRAYVLPAENDDREVFRVNPPAYGTGTGTGKIRSWSRIVIPENVFEQPANTAYATRIGIRSTVTNKEYSAFIGKNLETEDYTLPRNLWVGVEARMADKITLGPIRVTLWGDSKDVEVPFQ